MDNSEIMKIIEAILFVSGEPIEISIIAEVLLVNEIDLKNIVDEYAKKMLEDYRGIKIVRLDNRLQLATNEKYFSYIEKLFSKKALPKLTESVLETLAIVSFKQPISKSDIAKIRGVNSDYNINKLVEYNIICEVGRSDSPGRPILFGTTDDFLKYYGITSIDEFRIENQLTLDNFMEETDENLEGTEHIEVSYE